MAGEGMFQALMQAQPQANANLMNSVQGMANEWSKFVQSRQLTAAGKDLLDMVENRGDKPLGLQDILQLQRKYGLNQEYTARLFDMLDKSNTLKMANENYKAKQAETAKTTEETKGLEQARMFEKSVEPYKLEEAQLKPKTEKAKIKMYEANAAKDYMAARSDRYKVTPLAGGGYVVTDVTTGKGSTVRDISGEAMDAAMMAYKEDQITEKDIPIFAAKIEAYRNMPESERKALSKEELSGETGTGNTIVDDFNTWKASRQKP